MSVCGVSVVYVCVFFYVFVLFYFYARAFVCLYTSMMAKTCYLLYLCVRVLFVSVCGVPVCFVCAFCFVYVCTCFVVLNQYVCSCMCC